MAKYYCKYCGSSASSVSALTSSPCPKHPLGFGKGRHVLYEGSEKARYTCKFCGYSASSITSLVSSPCPRHPNGFCKGKHDPAL